MMAKKAAKKRDIEKVKGAWRLRYEALKRSKDFKELVELLSKGAGGFPLCMTSPGYVDNFWDVTDFIKIRDASSFEEAWKYIEMKLSFCENSKTPQGVFDYRDIVENEINWCIEVLKMRLKRDPTVKEFKKYFIENIKRDKQILIATIDLTLDEADLKNQVSNLVSKTKKKSPTLKRILKESKTWGEPTTYGRQDKIKRYFEVYDLVESKKKNEGLKNFSERNWKEIIREHNPTLVKSETFLTHADIFLREYQRDYEKALVILKNTAQGNFPGKYYK